MKMFKVLLGVVISMNAFAETYELKSMAPGLLPPDQPYISINPGYISFPNTEINTESSVTATITNSSSVNPLTGLRVVVDASVFSLVNNNCGTPAAPLAELGPLESCSTLIKFRPVVPGSYTGTFGASASNAVNGVQSILMSGYGQGYESFVDMTTDSLSFSILQGDSALKTLNFVNNGTYQSTNTRVELTGAPILTLTNANTCGTVSNPVSVGVNQNCSAPITVSSLNSGSFSSYATLKTANGTPVIKAFNVTVNPAISNAIVASGSLNFGVITPSTPKSTSVVVRNSGYVPATAAFVEVPSVDGLSIQTNTCGTSASPVNIPVNGTCSLFLSYTSDRAFTFSNTAVAVQGFDNALSIPVQGQVSGSEAFAEISSNRTAFSAIVPNADSVTYTFKNTGNIYSQNTYASISGATFSITSNTCGTQGSPIELAPNSTCSVTVQATSETAGNFSGIVAINSNSVTNVASKSLTFDAIGATAYAATSNGAVNFGSIVYDASNSTYVDRTVNITNTGNSALTVNTVSGLPAGTVFQSSTCSNVAVNGTCALVFRMKSDGTTSFTNAPITLNGPTGQDSITLTGSVVAQTRVATVTAGAPVDFGSVVQNTANVVKSVTVQNTGNSPLTISSVTGLPTAVTLTGNTCSAVAANATCDLTLSLSSVTIVSIPSTTVTTVGGTSNASFSVVGSVVSPTAYAATSNGAVNFGSIVYDSSNSAYVDRTVNVTNTGNSALTVNTVSGLPAGTVFQSSTCSSIAVNGTCALVFRMKSDGTTSFTNAPITLNGSTGQDAITLTGSVVSQSQLAAPIAGNPVNFGSVIQNSVSPSLVVTIKNNGNSAMTLTGITGLPSAVSLSDNTCSNISVSSTCSLTFTMSTASATSFSNVIATSTGATANANISFTGTVVAQSRIATVTAGTPIDFGTVVQNTANVVKSVTVQNTGNSPLTLTSVTGLPSAVTLTGNTCSAVAANATCSLTFTMSTASAATFSGTTVTTVGGTSNASFTMTGTVVSATAYAATSNGAVNFGSIVYDSSNSAYVDRTVNITNTGNSALTVNTVSGLPAGTVFQSSTCSNVAVNGTCALVFRMKSDGTTSFTNAPITLNGPTGQDAITLTGSVVAQTSVVSVTAGAPVAFGSVAQNTANVVKSVTVQNTGNSPLTISSVTGLPSSVSLTGNTCSAVAANATCSLSFTMSTTTVTSFSGTTVTTVGGTSNASLAMSGTVTAPSYSVYKFDFEGNTNNSGTLGGALTSTSVGYGSNSWTNSSGQYATVTSGATAMTMTDSGGGCQFSGDFTVEGWINWTTISTPSKPIVYCGDSATSTNSWYVTVVNGRILFAVSKDGSNGFSYSTPSAVITAGTWNHVAIVRSGTSYLMYVNGVLQTTTYAIAGSPTGVNGAPIVTGSTLAVGKFPYSTSSISGSIDMVRISKGIARYSSNFTPSAY